MGSVLVVVDIGGDDVDGEVFGVGGLEGGRGIWRGLGDGVRVGRGDIGRLVDESVGL